ncbi:MAG: ABC-type transport auxiliary lipoprotein family protein [Burkholderiales bacterium]|jgi:cholesterol transport system auxiliary component|nr:ABC-type transport auxiliary lipoprotein family protein [Burkholderiales bacterium]
MAPIRILRYGLIAAFGAAVIAGCSIGPQPRAAQTEYDFGPMPAQPAGAPRIREPVLVPEVTAPAWLDTSAMVYRLAYQDVASPRAYANSRWVMPPAALLTARLRSRLAQESAAGVLTPEDNARADVVLRVELTEFSQRFDAPGSSHAVVQVRASLIRGQRLAAQREFVVRKPAAAADAAGAAAAFSAAADEALDAVVNWAAGALAKH